MLNLREIIINKRNGHSIDAPTIHELIAGFAQGAVPDYQMSAFLMAVYFRGLDSTETQAMLKAMIESGTQLRWNSAGSRPITDKHSTGGIGDKTSLIVHPLLLASGCDVPMIAGRGLGHTGGTLDKLEALPGFQTQLSAESMDSLMKSIGGFIGGQTKQLVPADGRMYALRDVTGTVESLPLIVCSILSKKIAAGVKHLVMDVKTGDGAFMREPEDALRLARALEGASRLYGVSTTCLVTDMDSPLGGSIGNALEVEEALDVLEGKCTNEVATLSIELTAALLAEIDPQQSLANHKVALQNHLSSGKARELFLRMAIAQGAKGEDLERRDTRWLQEGTQDLPVTLPRSFGSKGAYLTRVRTRDLGTYLTTRGAGRRQLTDVIDPRVGLRQLIPLGTHVLPGQPICFFRTPATQPLATEEILQFMEFSDEIAPEDLQRISRAQNRVLAGPHEVRATSHSSTAHGETKE